MRVGLSLPPSGRSGVNGRQSNMFRFVRVLVHVLLLGILIAQAPAQSPNTATSPQTGFNPDAFSPLSRLRDATIRRMLGLAEDQIKKIDEVQSNWLAEFQKHSKLPRAEQNRAKLRELMRTFEGKATELLSHEQREQLDRLSSVTRFSTFVPTLTLLRSDHVQKALELSNEQKLATQKLYEQWLRDGEAFLLRPENQDLADATVGKQMARLMPFGEAWDTNARKSVLDMLTESQTVRLEQIELQRDSLLEGPRVLLRPENSEELRLSSRRKDQIRQLAIEFADITGIRGRKRLERKSKLYSKSLDVLTEQQLQLWRKKVGEPDPLFRSYFYRDDSTITAGKGTDGL